MQETNSSTTNDEKFAVIIKELKEFFSNPNLDVSVKLDTTNTEDQNTIRIERSDNKIVYFLPRTFLHFSERKLRSYLYTLYRTELERTGLFIDKAENELNTYLTQKELWGSSQIVRWLKSVQKPFKRV